MKKVLMALSATLLLSTAAFGQGTVTVVTSFSKDMTDPIKAAFEAARPGYILDVQNRNTNAGVVGNADLTNTPPWKRDVGMVFQSYALWPHRAQECRFRAGGTAPAPGRNRQADALGVSRKTLYLKMRKLGRKFVGP